MKLEQVIIIGGGPAGMMTAIQLRRYGMTPRIFEPARLGGLLWNANLVENYPGFPAGIPGPDLVSRFKRHFEGLEIEVTSEKVTELDYLDHQIVVRTQNQTYQTTTVVVATGTRPIEFKQEFIPKDAKPFVFYEVAPLLDLRDKKIGIIGAGDAAFDYALNLGRSNRVLILNRGEKIKALPLLVSRSKQNPNISYTDNILVKSVGQNAGRLVLRTLCEHEEMLLDVDFLIGAIGREENLPFLGERMKTAENHLVESGRLYYIGDVRNGIFRQTAIAVGDGLKAAMQIYHLFMED